MEIGPAPAAYGVRTTIGGKTRDTYILAPRVPVVVKITDAMIKDSESDTLKPDADVIARAVAERFPTSLEISVGLDVIAWTDLVTGTRIGGLTPSEVQNFLVIWDSGKYVQPFDFTLRVGRVKTERINHYA